MRFCMTLHAAKGLPGRRGISSGHGEKGFSLMPDLHMMDSQVEEEQRLCYVGMTHGLRNCCILLFAAERETYVGTTSQGISRFLLEIPEDHWR